jgi:hypothetical protein
VEEEPLTFKEQLERQLGGGTAPPPKKKKKTKEKKAASAPGEGEKGQESQPEGASAEPGDDNNPFADATDSPRSRAPTTKSVKKAKEAPPAEEPAAAKPKTDVVDQPEPEEDNNPFSAAGSKSLFKVKANIFLCLASH